MVEDIEKEIKKIITEYDDLKTHTNSIDVQ